jgi:hypothetical protein
MALSLSLSVDREHQASGIVVPHVTVHKIVVHSSSSIFHRVTTPDYGAWQSQSRIDSGKRTVT